VALYGQALFEAGDSNNANKQFDRALAADSELPEALLGKAQTALRAERPKDVHKALDLAEASLKVRVRPGRTLALLYTLRGRAFLLEGRAKVEPARTVLRSAVAIPGAPAPAYFFLGESLSAANSPEAFDAYAKYLELDPQGAYTKRAERAMHRK
jgi:tetratricopeptide (TPR) repeat protein